MSLFVRVSGLFVTKRVGEREREHGGIKTGLGRALREGSVSRCRNVSCVLGNPEISEPVKYRLALAHSANT